MTDPKSKFRKIYEFVMKHKGDTLHAVPADIKKLLRWALYYRRLFIVWADMKGGGKRIAAIGCAWRTERITLNQPALDFEHTEFGNYLYIHQAIVHPDFAHTGVLFQLLSLALYRYPEVHTAYWRSEHTQAKRTRVLPVHRLVKFLAHQVELSRLRRYIRRKTWEQDQGQVLLVSEQNFQTLKPVQ